MCKVKFTAHLQVVHTLPSLALFLCCYRIRFSVVLRSSYLPAALSSTTRRGAERSLYRGYGEGVGEVLPGTHSLQGLGHSRRACVIGVKCHGKELISSIIIIYGSLCVHLPQNTKHKISTNTAYKTQVRLFFKFVLSLLLFFALFLVCVCSSSESQFLIGVLGCQNAKNIASHFELLLFVVVVVGSL